MTLSARAFICVFTGVTEKRRITDDEYDGSCEFLVNMATVRSFDALECWYGGLVMKFSYDTLSAEYFLKTASGLIWDVPFASQSIMSKICNQGRCFMIDIDDGRMRLCKLGLDDAAVLSIRKPVTKSTQRLLFDSRDEISRALAKLDGVVS